MLAICSLVPLPFLKPAWAPGLENFEHYFTSMWDECNCVVVWAIFGTAFLWDSLTLAINKKKVKIEAIYMHVLERSRICLVKEASQLISVSRRQSHSGHNSSNLNDTPAMTTSTQNISLNSLSLSLSLWYLLKARDGEYLYGNVFTVLIINICFELYLELIMRLSDWELTHWKPVFVNIVG